MFILLAHNYLPIFCYDFASFIVAALFSFTQNTYTKLIKFFPTQRELKGLKARH